MATLEVIEPPKPEKTYVLTLTEQEARAVYKLSGAVKGEGALRNAARNVFWALNAVFPNAPWVEPAEYYRSSTAVDRYVETGE